MKDTEPKMPKWRNPGNKLTRWPAKKARATYPAIHLRQTKDPILAFLRRQGETYGLGYVPTDLGGKTAAELLHELRQRTVNVIAQLYGRHSENFMNSVGITKTTARHIYGSAEDCTTTSLHFRMGHAVLLAHIGSVRQTLTDLERELWVLMQLTHHPLLLRTPTANQKMASRKLIAQQLAERNPNNLKLTKPVLMPIRAQALINHPELAPHAAVSKELDALIQAGTLTPDWSEYVYTHRKTVGRRAAYLPPEREKEKPVPVKRGRGRPKGSREPRERRPTIDLSRVLPPLDE